MAGSSGQAIIKRLNEDRKGLINYIGQLKRSISDLQKRQMLADGALQYINKLLKEQEGKNGN